MTMALFNHDDRILITKIQTEGRIDHVPPHVYRIRPTPDGIVLVKDRKRFNAPEKFYGNVEQRANIIVDDFVHGGKSLGFILVGNKGSGKTLLSERVANKLLDRDIPIIVVDSDFPEGLLRPVVAAASPCMLYFDEFGKYYTDTAERQKLLTMFSDSNIGQVLFGVTANERNELDSYMLDRPGRFKYLIDFGNLSYKDVEEVLKDFKLTEEVSKYFTHYCIAQGITYDVLLQILPDLQKCRTRDEVVELLRILNVPSPVFPSYKLTSVFADGKAIWPVAHVGFIAERDAVHLMLWEREVDKVLLKTVIDFDTVQKEIVREFNPHSPMESEIIRCTVDETYTLEFSVRYTSSQPWTTTGVSAAFEHGRPKDAGSSKSGEGGDREYRNPWTADSVPPGPRTVDDRIAARREIMERTSPGINGIPPRHSMDGKCQ